jgi:hypothetical protein
VEVGLTCHVDPLDPVLQEESRAIAHAVDRPARALHLQALLQLPRLADQDSMVPTDQVRGVLRELASELPHSQEWLVPGAGDTPRTLRFGLANEPEVNDAMVRFHYLRSRRKGRPYALRTSKGRLVAFCVSSVIDMASVGALLSASKRPTGAETRVLSRVFAFEGAPHNTLSYLLAKAANYERDAGVTDLVTYVNPNMGFSGSSYRASGWHLLGEESGTRYRYLDGRYVTDRALEALFGARPDEEYKQLLGNRFAVSIMPLAPLLVFHRQIA